MNDNYIMNASKIEKLDNDALNLLKSSDGSIQLPVSGITVEPTSHSSLLEEESNQMSSSNFDIPAPNFITECFFMTHLLINMIAKKVE